ncbi:MAG: hypothetical protein HY513_02615 [Candidatus Aenigmarchaeota archaeon]|nr:hypothetical protein [Candidatus Aenigmarchaeota archaeon]
MTETIPTTDIKQKLGDLARYHAIAGAHDLYKLAELIAEKLPPKIIPVQFFFAGISAIREARIARNEWHYHRLMKDLTGMAEAVFAPDDCEKIREFYAGIENSRKEREKAEYCTGFAAYRSGVLGDYLKEMIQSGALKPGSMFLDLGAGKAARLLEAAENGLEAYGIEINPSLVIASKRKLSSVSNLADRCRIAQGSYYPADYIGLRIAGKALALEYEEKHCIHSSTSSRSGSIIFHPVATEKDPFIELGIAFSDIDVFFSYTWDLELASQLEIISRYARTGAILLNAPTNHDLCQRLLDELGLPEKLGLDKKTIQNETIDSIIVKYTKM